MPKFGVLVPLWPGSSDGLFAAIDVDNRDEAWDEVRLLYPDAKEIVDLGRCDMGSGLWVIPSAKCRGMDDLKEGDAVIVRTSWMSTGDNAERKVERITKVGKIRLDDGRLFNSVGTRQEPGWGLLVLFKKGAEPK